MTDSTARAALDRALTRDNLVLFYQPIHEGRTRKIVAAEALLRQWRETGEVREAGIITAAAEEGPALFALDSWTIRQAYADAASWQSRGAPDVRLNVNLSPREFQEGNVIKRMESLVLKCGIDLRKVNLEITEVAYIDHPEETKHVLNDLKEAGLALWLDDFGTGHSTLVHLQLFPVDGIKIPATFVKDIVTNERSRKIAQSLIRLAHDLGIQVIAEGIEHQTQLDILLESGCDYIQGFLFNKPMELREFEKLLAS